MPKEKKAGPDWLPPEWVNTHAPRWAKIRDVYDAVSTDGLKGKYLRQAIGESDHTYQTRVCLSTMDPVLEETIKANSGLLGDYDLLEDSPIELRNNQSNIDREGNNLTLFLAKSISMAFKFESVLLGCHLPVDGGDNRLPYFSCVDVSSDVFAPKVEVINGARTLSRVSIRSFKESDDGDFGVKTSEQYWVYRLRQSSIEDQEGTTLEGSRYCTLQQFEKVYRTGNTQSSGGGFDIEPVTEEELLTNIRQEPLTRLPFVWLGIDLDSSVGVPKIPPFYSLAEKLIKLFNQESELDSIQRRVNIPIPRQEHVGDVPIEPEDQVFGVDNVWHHAKDTEVGFAEPSGNAMEISEQRIQSLKKEIRLEQERFLGIDRTAAETATAIMLDASQSKMTLKTIGASIESAVQELFKLYAMYSDRGFNPEEEYGGIAIRFNSLTPPPSLQDIQTIPAMLDVGVLQDAYEARVKAKDLGYITDKLVEEADEMRAKGALRLVNPNQANNQDQPLAQVNLGETGGRSNAVAEPGPTTNR